MIQKYKNMKLENGVRYDYIYNIINNRIYSFN